MILFVKALLLFMLSCLVLPACGSELIGEFLFEWKKQTVKTEFIIKKKKGSKYQMELLFHGKRGSRCMFDIRNISAPLKSSNQPGNIIPYRAKCRVALASFSEVLKPTVTYVFDRNSKLQGKIFFPNLKKVFRIHKLYVPEVGKR